MQQSLGAKALASIPAGGSAASCGGFEWHYTPKHGSWLNMAESELAVLSGQCLDRRISCLAGLQNEVTAWLEQRNAHHAKANWRFTTADARIKLKSLYPAF